MKKVYKVLIKRIFELNEERFVFNNSKYLLESSIFGLFNRNEIHVHRR
jgi:hypothetical protein